MHNLSVFSMPELSDAASLYRPGWAAALRVLPPEGRPSPAYLTTFVVYPRSCEAEGPSRRPGAASHHIPYADLIKDRRRHVYIRFRGRNPFRSFSLT